MLAERQRGRGRRYLVLNRVRAGMCATAGDWPWSSFGATVGAMRRPRLTVDRLLGVFGGSRDRVARFVAEGSPASSLDGLRYGLT